ncbi:MAG TPA: DNA repair protein RadA, partial [Bacteroidales bacterium]|nr:DNA repair protein RadA [Bacteroidales bacterium]
CFAAEVGLSGEIRPVSRLDQRLAEANKLGLTRMFVSRYNTKGLDAVSKNCKVVPVGRIEELIRSLFGRESVD